MGYRRNCFVWFLKQEILGYYLFALYASDLHYTHRDGLTFYIFVYVHLTKENHIHLGWDEGE